MQMLDSESEEVESETDDEDLILSESQSDYTSESEELVDKTTIIVMKIVIILTSLTISRPPQTMFKM